MICDKHFINLIIQQLLDKILLHQQAEFPPFSKAEFIELVNNAKYVVNIVNIVNLYITLDY